MSVVDARIRIHHPCPYCDISVKFPRSLLLLWCDNRRDTFLLSAPDAAELRRILAALKLSFHARALLVEGRESLVTVPDFEWSEPPSVTGLARKAGVWVLPPVVYYEGRETYRLVAPAPANLNRLVSRLRRLGDVEVLSVSGRSGLESFRDNPMAGVHFFQGLTDRQVQALVAAFEGGLLEVPAATRWDSVAHRMGLSRSTFGEHLRKGQLRLLENSYDALRARMSGASEVRLLPATRPPRRVRRQPLRGFRPLSTPPA